MQAQGTLEQSAEIVMAYVAHNHVQAADLPTLLATVHAALTSVGRAQPHSDAPSPKLSMAQIRKSITPGALVSFEDGKQYKMLRRHLSRLGLTPDAYRAKWGLPSDYPMVTADYVNKRSALAKSYGFGLKRAPATPEAEPATPPEPPSPAPRGRRKKAPAA